MRRSWRTATLALATCSMLLVAGCGAEDFPNDPRVPAPVELTAKVDGEKVVVSPDAIGAGLATITIANLGDDDAQLVFSGPDERSTDPIAAGTIGEVKINLQQGTYDVNPEGSSRTPATLDVGLERPTAQNDLLLP